MKKLLIILLACLSLNVWADKWYIATTGSDTHGKGTLADPWLTLKHACDTVTGANFVGDTVVVGAGTFNETAQSSLGVGVSIYGAGATSIITTAAALDPIIALTSASEGTDGNQSISYVKLDGNSLTAYKGIYITARNNVSVHHCTFVDFLHNACLFRGRITGDGAPTTYSTGNKFYNNTVTNCSRYTTYGQGNLEFGGQGGLLIYNNTITQTDRGGSTHGYGIKATISNGYSHGVKIYNNTITVPPYEGEGYEFGIELWSQRGGWEIYNNTISGGIDFGGYDTDDSEGYGYAAKVYDNDIGRSSLQSDVGRGIIIESAGTLGISGGFYIYNNYFHHISNPLAISVGDAAGMTYEDIYIYYNIFNEIRKTTTYSGWVISVSKTNERTATFDNVQFLNNVAYCSAINYTSAGFWCGDSGHTWLNTVIRNNIFYNIYYPVRFEGCTVTTINVDNNNFYGYTDDITYVDCTVTGNTAANNITSDPTFVSAGNNFRLQSGSPAIDEGLDVGLTTDYDGNVVGSAPDIGCFERGTRYLINNGKLEMNNGKLVVINR